MTLALWLELQPSGRHTAPRCEHGAQQADAANSAACTAVAKRHGRMEGGAAE